MIPVRIWCLVAPFVLLLAAPAWSAEFIYQARTTPKRTDMVVATSDGRSLVTMTDVNQSLSILYYNTAQEIHKRQLAWLRAFIEDQLLASQAQKRGVTVAELLKTDVKPTPVTDGIVAQFLAERGRPGGKLTAQEREFLEKERWLVAHREYLDRLWQQAKIAINLPEPERPQVIVNEGNSSFVLGFEYAPVTIIEFCAFTSPQCRDLWNTLRQLVKQYGYRVRLVHRDYPLLGDPTSLMAAIAARCAQRQGRFWPYHDLLYANQVKLDIAVLKGYAKEVGLDAKTFDQCLDKRETAQEIEMDLYEGKRVGLTGLPSLFINTIYVPGALPVEELKKVIEVELARFGG